MSPGTDLIFIFDLHNTLYDEVLEYGGAFSAAITYVQNEAEKQNVSIDQDTLLTEIAAAHATSGSDWEEGIWEGLPSLQKFTSPLTIAHEARAIRRNRSEELTRALAYTDTIETLKALKKDGALLYVATEATANAAADAVRWLGLDGVLDGVFSWPYHGAYEGLIRSPQFDFPTDPETGVFLQKPHPFILASIVFHAAQQMGSISTAISVDEVFSIVESSDAELLPILGTLPAASESEQVRGAISALKASLVLKESGYAHALRTLLGRCYYVGDSYFRDGYLAHNAQVPFVHAAYGKAVLDKNKIEVEQAEELMYRVTGWEPALLRLTHEATRSQDLTRHISPLFTCKKSLHELVTFLEKRA